MKNSFVFLSVLWAFAVPAQPQTIFDALRKGDYRTVKAPIEESPALLDARDAEGSTPLHYAASSGDVDLVHFFIDKGANLEVQNGRHHTPLHVAATNDRKDAVPVLIARGAAIETRDDYQRTALILCARERGRAATGAVRLEAGAEVNAVDKFGDTAVNWAPMITYPGEVYSPGGLLMMKRVDGCWTPSSWAPFSGPDANDDVPFSSPAGRRIYFMSRRQLPGASGAAGEGIWFTDRTAAGWSEPRPLDPMVNGHAMHWEFSLDRQGNLYFGGRPPDSKGMDDIYVARFNEGKYERPVNVGAPISSTAGENTPFIAPDGSYLLFSREYDIWVSFGGAGNTWSEPVRLGPEVNSPSVELCPIVTADGKYLFFLSRRDGESHAYWARADIIETARSKPRPENPSGAEEFQAIEQSIRDCIGWAKTKDFGRLYSVIANDPDFIEVHPDGKVVRGFDEFRQAEQIWRSPDFKAVRYEIRDLRIKLSRSRDVAWFYCILDDINEWKGQPANWENTRWTGVLEKRDGLWIMVQQHFSK